ncbi:hypothetical protein ACFV1J_32695, partial [Streptomyces sp. NPDC059649]
RTATNRTATDRSAGDTDRTAAHRTAADRSADPYRAATRYGSAEHADHASWAHRSAGSGTAVGGQEGAAAGARITEHADTAGTELTDPVRPAAEQAGPIAGAGTVTGPVTGAVRAIGDAVGGALPVQLPSVERPGQPGHGDGSPHDGGGTGGEGPSGVRTAAPVGGPAVVPPAHCVEGKAQTAPQLPAALSGQGDTDRHGLPEQQLPQGPTAPAPHSAGDQHGPRGGDQHSAAPADAPRFRLLPGGVRTADGAPTRRRAEEILEFPG